MRRPAGVVVAAVLLALFTLLGVCVLLAGVAGIFLAPGVPHAAGVHAVLAVTDLLLLAWLVFCGWTVAGLFRMQKWARYGMLVIGGCTAAFAGVGAVGILLVRNAVPAPATPSPVPMSVIFAGIAGVYGLIAVLGVWWLVYFNLRPVRASFAGAAMAETAPGMALAAPAEGGGRAGWRIVIVVWAWLMLVSVLYFPLVLAMHMPLFLFGTTVRGGAAVAVVLVLVTVQVYLGIGLLKKWKPAWFLGLFWQIYSIGMFATFLLPAVRGRFAAYNLELRQRWMPVPSPAAGNQMPFLMMGVVLGVAMVVLLGVALLERREDYLQA